MLQLINRARSNPPAEARRLLKAARDDHALRAMSRTTDLAAFARIMSRAPSRPPLAFNDRLIAAARAQNEHMLANNEQRHTPQGYLHDPAVATAPEDGLPYYSTGNGTWAVGENLFAYTRNVQASSPRDYVDYLHTGLMLDWGNPEFGHLKNLLAPGPGPGQGRRGQAAFREIGIGLLMGAEPVVAPTPTPDNPANAGLSVGPVLVTQEFAGRAPDTPRLVGAAYRDTDHDGFYTPGEGLDHVLITAVSQNGHGAFQARAWDTGGYALALPPGAYRVTARRDGQAAVQTTFVRIARDNVAWDITDL